MAHVRDAASCRAPCRCSFPAPLKGVSAMFPTLRRRPRRPPVALPGRTPARLCLTTIFTVFVTMAQAPQVWAVADIPTVIANLRNWIVGLLASLATLFLTFGGL